MTTKRSQLAHFMNVGTSESPDYRRMGEGITTGAINYNANTTQETYIHQDSGVTLVDSYAPTLPIEQKVSPGDDVYDFVEALRKIRAVSPDNRTDIVNVTLFDTPSGGEYPAEKQTVEIQFETFGGEGGVSLPFNYTLNYIGDPVIGTFDPVAREFTPASS